MFNLIDRFTTLFESKHFYLVFFGFSIIIFSPFFLQGYTILASTDSLYNHYPNLLYGYRAIYDGSFGLWNPLIFGGTDFTSSFHHHMLHPIHWILLLFPEKYIFHALTMILFLEHALVGVISFKIFRLYHQDVWAALFLTIIVQLGGFMWCAITTFIAVHMMFASVASIYIILSFEKRRKITNFVLLSFCFVYLLLIGHVGYIMAFGIPIIIVFLIKSWPDNLKRPWTGITPVVIGAAIFGLCIALPRLQAVLSTLLNEGAMFSNEQWLPSLANMGYFSLTGFVPEALGIYLADALPIAAILGLGEVHTQFHSMIYFGIVPIAIVVLALLNTFGLRVLYLAILFVAIASIPLKMFQPLSDVFNLILLNYNHEILWRTLTTFLMVLFLNIALIHLVGKKSRLSSKSLTGIVAIVGIVLCFLITLYTRILYQSEYAIALKTDYWLVAPKVAILMLFIVCGYIMNKIWFKGVNLNLFRWLTNSSSLIFILTAFLVGISIVWLEIYRQWTVINVFLYAVGSGAWAIIIIFVARFMDEEPNNKIYIFRLIGIGFAVLVLFLIVPVHEMIEIDIPWQRYFTANAIAVAMGTTKFILLSFITIELFARWNRDVLKYSQLLPLLAILTAGELLFFTKTYSYVATEPFIQSSTMYPMMKDVTVDSKQYRVNNPNLLMQYDVPFVRHRQSNIPMVYNLPTYGGVDSDLDKHFIDFIFAFEPNTTAIRRMGIVARLKNPRLLDLLGIKYDVQEDGRIITRPDALARFSLFSAYYVEGDRQTSFQNLKSGSFNPTNMIIIDDKPFWRKPFVQDEKRFIPINYDSLSTSNITIEVDLERPSMLLFNDNYNRDWHAFFNGDEIPIFKANVRAMAISLPSGKGIVEFKFLPQPFLSLLKVSFTASTILLIIALYILVTGLRRKRLSFLNS